jgi:hypothetical protein
MLLYSYLVVEVEFFGQQKISPDFFVMEALILTCAVRLLWKNFSSFWTGEIMSLG